ncbi:hypothetical protein FisN_4Hh191 [Fistulifera solaris]|uniref:Uncharacterized protein n=1 Tax=Fistulifera solaris TaxID=1519565 RepID=A0A1Z5K8Z7_FISSO|nr:hypothetical protein FisN_4Hh191 [Fistulifera solaris]|eukprot:GAX22697.1 hypothetical protein FisN_4Hh191 [Fistulifera solaris]
MSRTTDPYLQIVRRDRMTPRQQALVPAHLPRSLTLYEFRQDPTRLDDINWQEYGSIAIWSSNGSVIFIIEDQYFKPFWGRHVLFLLSDRLRGSIYGETDAAIAETATFFWSLQYPEHWGENHLQIRLGFVPPGNSEFDFAALLPAQLEQILDSTRFITLSAGTFTAEQSVILATRPYPLNIVLSGRFTFVDQGTAFVHALQTRESPFGFLEVIGRRNGRPFSVENLQLLFQLNFILEHLRCHIDDEECALLPISAKVNKLHYRMSTNYVRPDDFASIDIEANDFTLELSVDGNHENWDSLLIAALHRVAELGHFERLCFSVFSDYPRKMGFDRVARVVDALIRAIHANPSLACLDLSSDRQSVRWSPHFQPLFQSMEEHPGLRTFVVQSCTRRDEEVYNFHEPLFQFDFSWLQQLLSSNRRIAVVDRSGQICSNGPVIDRMYLLNRFYLGSESLLQELTASRPALVPSALVDRASNNAQYIALLLSHHTDVLCGVVQDFDVGEVASLQSVSEGEPSSGTLRPNALKREAPSHL